MQDVGPRAMVNNLVLKGISIILYSDFSFSTSYHLPLNVPSFSSLFVTHLLSSYFRFHLCLFLHIVISLTLLWFALNTLFRSLPTPHLLLYYSVFFILSVFIFCYFLLSTTLPTLFCTILYFFFFFLAPTSSHFIFYLFLLTASLSYALHNLSGSLPSSYPLPSFFFFLSSFIFLPSYSVFSFSLPLTHSLFIFCTFSSFRLPPQLSWILFVVSPFLLSHFLHNQVYSCDRFCPLFRTIVFICCLLFLNIYLTKEIIWRKSSRKKRKNMKKKRQKEKTGYEKKEGERRERIWRKRGRRKRENMNEKREKEKADYEEKEAEGLDRIGKNR